MSKSVSQWTEADLDGLIGAANNGSRIPPDTVEELVIEIRRLRAIEAAGVLNTSKKSQLSYTLARARERLTRLSNELEQERDENVRLREALKRAREALEDRLGK